MKLRTVLNSVRTRITLWHLSVLVLTLLIYMGCSMAFLWHQLKVELKKSLREDVEVVETFLRPSGGRVVWTGHEEHQGREGRWVEIRSQAGELIYRNFGMVEAFAALQPLKEELHERKFHSLRLVDGRNLLVVQEIHQVAGIRVAIVVGRSTDRLFSEMWHLLMIQVLLLPIVILLASAGGYFVAGRVLVPLKKIVARMQAISADRLDERLPVDNPDDELGRLSITFNELLVKLDCSFRQMRQFTADASHELRTPLSALRSVGEMALRHPRDEAAYQETIASMLEEVEKMTRLVTDLLALARSDSGIFSPAFEKTDLGVVVNDEVALLKILAEEKAQRLSIDVEQPCSVLLDRAIFRQAISNILHNAIQYTPEGKEIRVVVGKDPEGCYVEISDAGQGIAPEHQDRVFDRFYRVDKVRSRETGGAGLGLAIATRAVAVHGGHIDLSSRPGCGSTFRIRIPEDKAQKGTRSSYSEKT